MIAPGGPSSATLAYRSELGSARPGLGAVGELSQSIRLGLGRFYSRFLSVKLFFVGLNVLQMAPDDSRVSAFGVGLHNEPNY
jgi:hypothetical protein